MTLPGFGEIAEKLRRSTVTIRARGRPDSGSGIVWSAKGVIVTNAHVARAATNPTVELWDRRAYSASVSSVDDALDLAALTIAANALSEAEIADSDRLRAGELVIAVGNPLGFTGALTTGVVHALGPLPGLGRRPWVQANVRLAPGNSGGPLADAQGRVVGVNTMIASGLGLAIPANVVAAFLRRQSSAPMLGVTVRPTPLSAGNGRAFAWKVLEVARGSAAETASLLPGDLLIAANGHPFHSPDDLSDAVEKAAPGPLPLRFLRNGGAARQVGALLEVRLSVAA